MQDHRLSKADDTKGGEIITDSVSKRDEPFEASLPNLRRRDGFKRTAQEGVALLEFD